MFQIVHYYHLKKLRNCIDKDQIESIIEIKMIIMANELMIKMETVKIQIRRLDNILL